MVLGGGGGIEGQREVVGGGTGRRDAWERGRGWEAGWVVEEVGGGRRLREGGALEGGSVWGGCLEPRTCSTAVPVGSRSTRTRCPSRRV